MMPDNALTDLDETQAPSASPTEQRSSAEVSKTFTPWLAGAGIALGQAALATACTLPTVGKCAGCGSCAVAVASLYSWALRRKQADRRRLESTGLEPFESRSRANR